MIPSVRLREKGSSSRGSERGLWSTVSVLLRILLCVGILPMIFPESEALVTNLSLYNSKLCHRSATFCYTTTTQSSFSRRDLPVQIHNQQSVAKRIHSAHTLGRIKTRLYIRNEARYSTGSLNSSVIQFTSWILSITSAFYTWCRSYRWMYKLSIGLLIAHFVLSVPDGLFGTPLHQTVIAWYMTRLNENPILTKSISAGVIACVADYGAQWLQHLLRNPEKVDQPSLLDVCSIYGQYSGRRGISTLADGLFISGPLMHFSYEFMETVLPIAGGAWQAAIVHVLADSVFLDSILVASRFFTTGLMEGLPLRHLLPQFQSVYVPSLKASWVTSLLMSPLQFSCFRFLPLSVRVLSVNILDVIWDAVISFMTHRSR